MFADPLNKMPRSNQYAIRLQYLSSVCRYFSLRIVLVFVYTWEHGRYPLGGELRQMNHTLHSTTVQCNLQNHFTRWNAHQVESKDTCLVIPFGKSWKSLYIHMKQSRRLFRIQLIFNTQALFADTSQSFIVRSSIRIRQPALSWITKSLFIAQLLRKNRETYATPMLTCCEHAPGPPYWGHGLTFLQPHSFT